MTRREAREQAFCLLFEQSVGGCAMEEIISAAAEARDLAPNSFTEELAYGVEENRERLDQVIGGSVRGWSLRRLSKVALTLLRIAVFEMLYVESIPASVSINEAVELAKTYGGQGDAPYINGVLGAVMRAYCPGEGPREGESAKEKTPQADFPRAEAPEAGGSLSEQAPAQEERP